MKNNVIIFNNEEFGQVRTLVVNKEPIFCLGDLCKALELTAKGVKQRLSDEVISNYPIEDSLGRKQNALFVNEDGLYDVILESRKENARKFRKWVTSDVLPTIRKTGGYVNNDNLFIDTYFPFADDFTKLTSREEELYYFKLKYKKKLFRENNLNYVIIHPRDLENKSMEELFFFLNIKKVS